MCCSTLQGLKPLNFVEEAAILKKYILVVTYSNKKTVKQFDDTAFLTLPPV
jgi:hypothetical protein